MIDLKFYSPEEEISYAPITNYVRLFIKRDDLIDPFISGNKWRKLKFNLLKAQENKKNHLVTFGGAYSNHVLATAAAGAKLGFKTTAFIRGEEANNQLLDFCNLFGMHLVFVGREAYKNKEELYNQYFKEDKQTYLLNEGGFGADAEKGCREIVSELKQEYDHIFCSGGTGATAAGIINQIEIQKVNTQFHLVPALKGGSFLKEDIKPLLLSEKEYVIHDEYHFGGYAKTQPALLKFIKDFTQQTGLLIDPVYNSKTLFAIQDLASKNYFPKNSSVLMIHTGGLFGILGMLEKF
jgi:1-aminocyclopropane-1-carboxylate deaminase